MSSRRVGIEDDDWGAVESTISLLAPFTEAAVSGLDAFSHVEILFVFDKVREDSVCTAARRPRGRSDWPEVGIFAQRAKDRPNRIGSSVCELLGVTGTEIRVRGLDAIDGTPVLDIKPYMEGFGPRSPVSEPPWATELMAGYF